ncbi:MAG TPA: hypothetical protein VG649_11165, partial [Candidatus Angelobacter sp.]|nr:hypothetical protein [Candidatus Angelobacter sp.]
QPQVQEVVVCNPRRNALLKEGSKSDKVDGIKRKGRNASTWSHHPKMSPRVYHLINRVVSFHRLCLLSRQTREGVVERTGKTGPPHDVRVNTVNS